MPTQKKSMVKPVAPVKRKRKSTQPRPPHPDAKVLRPAEAAFALGRGTQTLADWRHRGIGPKFFNPAPRIVLYRLEDLNEWLGEQQQATRVQGQDAK